MVMMCARTHTSSSTVSAPTHARTPPPVDIHQMAAPPHIPLKKHAPVDVEQRRVGPALDAVGGRLGLPVLRRDEEGRALLLVPRVDVRALFFSFLCCVFVTFLCPWLCFGFVFCFVALLCPWLCFGFVVLWCCYVPGSLCFCGGVVVVSCYGMLCCVRALVLFVIMMMIIQRGGGISV